MFFVIDSVRKLLDTPSYVGPNISQESDWMAWIRVLVTASAVLILASTAWRTTLRYTQIPMQRLQRALFLRTERPNVPMTSQLSVWCRG
jgi:hypothetical protein